MPIVVQKYGGTSVGDTDRIRGVADRIVRAREQGQDVVVVVSAMGETTDDLLDKASDITPVPEPRELDMLLTAGERIAMSLLAIAVNARGCRAASYTGSQAGIITDTQHGKARIVEIRPHPDQGVPRRRQRRDPRRVPGPVDRLRHHDARARGLGHDRRRDGGRPRGRGVRDLHRRRRRLHRRPPDPPRGPQDRPHLLRGDARARRRRREGPPAAVRGVRSTPRRPDPRSELPG